MHPLAENANISAFLAKLWKMVNDPSTDHLICWSPAGNSFIIQNQAQFWYELLPSYYKHNNMSSFVRQLNMYGFHKISSTENGSMESDKDEIQFYHQYFQKGEPELLHNIKRKVTVAKSENNSQNVLKVGDLSKVLSDVKYLYGRQSSVDSQLSAMKQENTVLWRELALLRQKHLKQQQIVNKLIQFLVTLVQPSPSSRMGVSVKRRMPLMLHESPAKKPKIKKKSSYSRDIGHSGPTIHELENEIELTPEEICEQSILEPQIKSPETSEASNSQVGSSLSPEGNAEDELSEQVFENVDSSELVCETEDAETEVVPLPSPTSESAHVFLNPAGGNTLLSDIANGSYNAKLLNTKAGKKINYKVPENSNTVTIVNPKESNSDMQVATRINSGDDLDGHLDTTQSEIEQLKDILRGCNGLDANALLGLFNDDAPSYGLPYNPNEANKDNPLDTSSADPLVAGTELATYNMMDFSDLLDVSLDGENDSTITEVQPELDEQTINTPMVIKSEPVFPNFSSDL